MKISLDQDNLPVIEPMSDEPVAKGNAKKSDANIQCMVSMTKAEWKVGNIFLNF